MLNCPVLFLIFNRPDTTKQVFEVIRKARPRQLFVAADGARAGVPGEIGRCDEAREIIKRIDWDCEVKTFFREENLGCKMAVSSAITWFFEHVEHGIILEDDCLPSDSFFTFCADLLERYKDEERIMMISGDNFQNGIRRGNASYFFTQIPHIWGWATWRRAWRSYCLNMEALPAFVRDGGIEGISDSTDVQHFWLSNFINTYLGRIETWDFQWMFAILRIGGLCICPQTNMISNIGFGEAATHTRNLGSHLANIERDEMEAIVHPDKIRRDNDADAYTYRFVCDVGCHSKKWLPVRLRKRASRRRKARKLIMAFGKGQVMEVDQ